MTRSFKSIFSGPFLVFILCGTLIPMGVIALYGLTDRSGTFTFDNVLTMFQGDHAKALGLSLALSLISTVICLILAFPLGLILKDSKLGKKGFMVFLFILPMWMNFLLRTMAWQVLLEKGGVTFSGGEPFQQSGFMFECLQILKGKLHTAIQTSGFCSRETFQKALELADYFLFDLKVIDEEGHKKHTGVSNRVILENFVALVQSGKDFTIRVPLIPGVTDTQKNIEDIARVLTQNGVHYVEVLPYNKMAGGKYAMVQREYTPMFDEQQEVVIRKDIFDAYGIEYKVL